ncbi:MAG TPA: SGNH/GDSL hydrolase family protein [Candidatus Hydrogenedentes bacterium]|nr:SGNH/GDSL hydrolase family protein [Candidatus Hydrogenedentota bacterium]HRT18711.1 SGNH/GDSL hydrolase family protein [Candidatus Hydrogenedentota bacterium]HRT63731.1 SGNH/GDSL hydrolase family protein [Candidatus Hydrogenedentota bacterium]
MERKAFGGFVHAAAVWGMAVLGCLLFQAPLWQGMILAMALAAASVSVVLSAVGWWGVCAAATLATGLHVPFWDLFLAGVLLMTFYFFYRGTFPHPVLVWDCLSGGAAWVRPSFCVIGTVFLAALAVRGVPLFSTALLALLCFMAAFTLPAFANRVACRFAEAFGLAAGTVMVSLLLAECGARILLEPRPARQIHERHPEYLFTLRPRAVAQQRIRLGPDTNKYVGIRISAQGFRDREYGPKSPDEFRILLLGDSFAMGFAVEEEDGMARHLERLLARDHPLKRISVINGGMTGAGPWQEWGILRDRGLALLPDVVILQLCTVNDIDNSLEYVGKRQRAYYRNWHVLLETLRHMDHPAMWAEYAAQRHSRLYREIWFQTGLHPWVLHGINTLRWATPFSRPDVPPGENRPNEIESDLNEWYPELHQGLALLEWFVTQIRDMCAENRIRFAAFSIPPHPVLDDAAWRILTRSFNPRMYDRGKGLRVFDEMLRRNGIPSFSIVEALKSHPRIDEVYHVWDGHLTGRGNKLVAQAIRDYLAASGIFPRQ